LYWLLWLLGYGPTLPLEVSSGVISITPDVITTTQELISQGTPELPNITTTYVLTFTPSNFEIIFNDNLPINEPFTEGQLEELSNIWNSPSGL